MHAKVGLLDPRWYAHPRALGRQAMTFAAARPLASLDYRGQVNVVGSNLLDSELPHRICGVCPCECLAGAFPSKPPPRIRTHVREYEVGLHLRKPVEGVSLWDHVPEELVVPLAGRPVRGPVGVGVERPHAIPLVLRNPVELARD